MQLNKGLTNHEPANTGDSGRIMIYAMSDIHGCMDEFERKLKLVYIPPS